ncbi:superfamily II DNA/RNA helicase [Rhodococcus sp. 27YEA15]|uniref:DEAD/DEAH box helicase n=1 Tax=Rhodococcus sp. 27YEA15 TaxID=3156259 RepID=UPI003C7A228E
MPKPTLDSPAATEGPSFIDLGIPAVMVHALRRSGIDAPFPIQVATIPDVLAGRDVLGRGATGSGKTLAFGLPMLVRLKGGAGKRNRPRGIVLAPTRELAVQIHKALDDAAIEVGLRVASAVGGIPIKRQADILARGVDLLVATPGRLIDLIEQGSVLLDDVVITTIDEADHMADLGFIDEVAKILDATPKDGQRLLYSATLDGKVDDLVSGYLRNPASHATAPPIASVMAMEHHLLYVDAADKRSVTAHIASRAGRTIMFVKTKHGVDRLAQQLHLIGVSAGALHGDKTQNQRTKTLESFADGTTPVLVATDVAARGIHVDGITLVVHVDPPAEAKDYLHRAGRTARAGAAGVVVTIVTDDERAVVEKLTKAAGITAHGVRVRPDDLELTRITGAQEPTGIPVAAPDTTVAVTHTAKRGRQEHDTAGRTAVGGRMKKTGDTRAVASRRVTDPKSVKKIRADGTPVPTRSERLASKGLTPRTGAGRRGGGHQGGKRAH